MRILGAGGFGALETCLLFLLEFITSAKSKAFWIAYFHSLYDISIASKRKLETIFILFIRYLYAYYIAANILSTLQMLTNLSLITII